MNSLMNGNIFMQAFGAMLRGENPKSFLANLAKKNPMLQGMNFDNLQKTAQEVCDKKGVNMNEKLKEIESQFPK